MPEDYVSPLGSLVNWIDSERKRSREQEDADLDQKIALIHDMITGPGANPARTADGIRSILELQQAKGGRQKGKRKAGLAGFMGANEEMMPDFLAQLIHKDRPFEGPTYSEQTSEVRQPTTVGRLPGQMDQQPSFGSAVGINQQPDEQISSRDLSGGFSGQSVLKDPVMIPPPPLDAAPTGNRMLGAARQMQTQPQGVELPGAMGMQTKRTPLPDEQQPFRIAPEELAQQAGEAAGIRENAIYDARNKAKIDMWKRAGLSDNEIREMLLREATGAGAQLQIQDAGYVKVGDQVIHAIRQLNPRSGMWETVDQLSGLPIPPGAIPVGAPSSSSETDPTSYKEYERSAAEAKAAGKPFPTYEEWLTIDANRKRPTTTIRMVGGTDLTPQDRTAINMIIGRYQASPLVKAKDRLVTLESNIRQIGANPGNAAAQLALGYSFVQALDTYQSAVREGELRNLNTIDSKLGNLQLWGQQMLRGELMRPEIAVQVAQAAAELSRAIRSGFQQKQAEFGSQAKVNGPAVEAAWQQFVAGLGGQSPTGNPGAPKVGDTKTARNGLTLYFDGQGWTDTPVVPTPPGARR